MRLFFFSILSACVAGFAVPLDRHAADLDAAICSAGTVGSLDSDALELAVASSIGTRSGTPINRMAAATSGYPVCLYRNNDQSGWFQCIHPMANIIANVPRPCYGFPIDPEISSLGFFRKVYADVAWQAAFYDGPVCNGEAIYFTSNIIKVDRLDVYGWDNRIKSVNFFWNTETPDATLLDPASFSQDDAITKNAISPRSEHTEIGGVSGPLCLYDDYELRGGEYCVGWPDPKYNDQCHSWCGNLPNGVNISSIEFYRMAQDAKPWQVVFFDAIQCTGKGVWFPFFVYNARDLRKYGWDKRFRSVAFWWGNKPVRTGDALLEAVI